MLLDLNTDVDAVGDGRRVDVENTGDTSAVENIPGDARALHRRHDAVLAVGARQGAFQRTAKDRVAPVRDARDFHRRPRRGKVRHIAGELAERSFNLIACGIVADISLEHDLRGGGNLEIDRFAANQLRGLAAVGAHHIPLAYPGHDRRSRQERHDGIPADHTSDRHGLFARGPLGKMRTPMLAAFDEKKRRSILVADHPPVDTDVHHPRLRISRHDAGEGMDVAAAFEVLPLGDGKFSLVDGIAAHDDLLHRPRFDDDRRDRLAVFLHHVLNEVTIGDVAGKAESKLQARLGSQTAHKNLGAPPISVALDALEQQRGPLFLEDAPGNGADLAIPVHLGGNPP